MMDGNLITIARIDVHKFLEGYREWRVYHSALTKEQKKKALSIIYVVEGKEYLVRMNSLRYAVFEKSIVCAGCGLEANHFKLQSGPQAEHRAHYNLYYEDDLFTKDHIVPKSKGGSDQLDNLQTMCYPCNHNKDDGSSQ
jgi:hypothetical protein